MKNMELKVLTPDKSFFSGKISKLTTEDFKGRLGILPEHVNLISILKPNITYFQTVEGKEYRVFISKGILQINDDVVEILAESCEWPEDIDMNRAEEAKKRAEERLNSSSKDNIDVKRAEIALMRSCARLKLKNI